MKIKNPHWWEQTKVELEKQTGELQLQFAKFAQRSPSAWSVMKTAIARAYTELKRGYRKALARLADPQPRTQIRSMKDEKRNAI